MKIERKVNILIGSAILLALALIVLAVLLAIGTFSNTEKEARIADVASERSRIDALLEGTDVDLDQFKEVISAYQMADTSILQQITTMSGNIENNQTLLIAEKDARIADVASERSRINALLDGTDINLNQLKELITAYQTSDSSLLARINTMDGTITGVKTEISGMDIGLSRWIGPVTDPAKIIFCSEASVGTPATNAFDGIYGQDYVSYAKSWRPLGPPANTTPLNIDDTPQGKYYIGLDLGEDPKIIRKFQVFTQRGKGPMSFKFVGSNDHDPNTKGSGNWTELYSHNSGELTDHLGSSSDSNHLTLVASNMIGLDYGHLRNSTQVDDPTFRYVALCIITHTFYPIINQLKLYT